MGSFKEFVNNDNSLAPFLSESLKSYDHEIAYLYQRQTPISQIKTEIGMQYEPVSTGEVYRSLSRTGVRPARRKHATYNDVVSLLKQKVSFRTIADLTGYSERQVRNIKSRMDRDD